MLTPYQGFAAHSGAAPGSHTLARGKCTSKTYGKKGGEACTKYLIAGIALAAISLSREQMASA
jgi:hypothetical protein